VTIPPEVQELALRRQQARADKDYAASDGLRTEIAALGWVVKDTPQGQELAVAPPYLVLPSVGELADRSDQTTAGCVVTLVVEGWPEDLRTCVAALLQHTDADLVLLENGETDAGATVHELAQDPRVEELHVARPAGWAEARNALIRYATADVHVLMDLSTVLEGDALTPLVAALRTADAAGWRGVHVEDGWLAFADSPAGEVEALLSYLIAVRRTAALEVPLPAKARFYRNADMEWSFLLREQGKRLVALDLPVRQDRHRGYHDSDPVMRDRESKKTYDRFLQRFRGREDLRLPRTPDTAAPL
jgi:glycosyltransferase involved in cell wall biosynthesis